MVMIMSNAEINKLCYSLEGSEFFDDLEEMFSYHDIDVNRKEKFQIPIAVGIKVEMKFMEYFGLNRCLESMNECINENMNNPADWYTKTLESNDEEKLEKIIGDFLFERLGKIPFYQIAQDKEHALIIENGDYWVTGEYFND